jgi:hypothetical protein
MRNWIGAGACALALVLAGGCQRADDSSKPKALEPVTPVATSFVATSTKSSPDEYRTRLSADPTLAPIFRAVEQGDVGALLSLIDYEPWKCGGGGDDGCPPGVVPGTEVLKTNTGPDTFYVGAETLRPYFELILKPPALGLDFFARSTSMPSHILLGFDGPVKGPGFAPLEDASSALSGVLLTIDTTRSSPIVRIDLLAEFRRAAVVGVAAAAAQGTDYMIEFVTQVN